MVWHGVCKAWHGIINDGAAFLGLGCEWGCVEGAERRGRGR